MTTLERLLLSRADEQTSKVQFIVPEGPREVYTARCKHPDCMKLVVYWNKSQRCTPHGNTFRKNERERLRREARYSDVVKKSDNQRSGCATRELQGPSLP